MAAAQGVPAADRCCAFCGHGDLNEVIDFGEVALAGAFLKQSDFQRERKYPLRVCFCPKCCAVQVTDKVDPAIMFANYFYFSSAIRTLRYYTEALDKVHGEVGPETADRFSYAVHEPLGVIGAIMPWNFPIHLTMWKIAPALAMGNSIVLKPAELTSMTALKLGELALEAPAGWKIEPASQAFTIASAGELFVAAFTVTPPAAASRARSPKCPSTASASRASSMRSRCRAAGARRCGSAGRPGGRRNGPPRPCGSPRPGRYSPIEGIVVQVALGGGQGLAERGG